MNLWKANPLDSGRDLVQRGLFRVLWCVVGYALAVLILGLLHKPIRHDALMVGLPLVCLLGVVVDAIRLKSRS